MLITALLLLLYLPGETLTNQPQLVIDAGMHTAVIREIAVDAAERFLVTASEDKTLRVWSLPEGICLNTLRPPIGPGDVGKLYAVALSADGRQLVCGGRTDDFSLYVFDLQTGTMTRPIKDLDNVTYHLAYSADGRFLVACLGGTHGIRVYHTATFKLAYEDRDYAKGCYAAGFFPDGRLATTSFDGELRLYDANFTRLARAAAPGGKQPFQLSISPNGQEIAVGFDDSYAINLVAGKDLSFRFAPDLQTITNGDLSSVSWSANGQTLYAAGRFQRAGEHPIVAWSQAGHGPPRLLPGPQNSLLDLKPAKDGGVYFCSGDPALGKLDPSGGQVLFQSPPISDFRAAGESFQVGDQGLSLRFAFAFGGKKPARFDLAQRALTLDPGPGNERAPLTTAADLVLTDWKNTMQPKLAGKALALQSNESSRSLAIQADGSAFLLGAEWRVRYFDRLGQQRWQVPAPGVAWAVNLTADGKLALAAFADGTIRWFRVSDGTELLAFFAHADQKRWVAWTPSGYYDASPGGEALIGWHVNRGSDRGADFYPASRFRDTYYRPDVVRAVLLDLDEARALASANQLAQLKASALQASALGQPPAITILSPADFAPLSSSELNVTYSLRAPADAPVTEVRIKLDGRPLEGQRRATLEQVKERYELKLDLPPRNCTVSLIALNRFGESQPANLRIRWVGPSPSDMLKPSLYVLAVGVGYEQPDLTLTYPPKDARDFSTAMQNQEGKLYRKVTCKLLDNLNAGRDEILDGLEWIQKETTARDVAMVFLAGHGLNDADGNLYFLPSGADPNRLMSTAIPWFTIDQTLKALAGKALLFMDTCHSGNISGGRRGLPDLNLLVNELTRVESAVVVFTSSTGSQYSLEHKDWNNGAFTKALVEGLNGKADFVNPGVITINSLDAYIADRVKKLTDGRQAPTTIKPANIPDFPIAVSP